MHPIEEIGESAGNSGFHVSYKDRFPRVNTSSKITYFCLCKYKPIRQPSLNKLSMETYRLYQCLKSFYGVNARRNPTRTPCVIHLLSPQALPSIKKVRPSLINLIYVENQDT